MHTVPKELQAKTLNLTPISMTLLALSGYSYTDMLNTANK
jgi:hypothetical protein